MMHVALIAAMYYGAIFIFGVIGLLGVSMEMVLRQTVQPKKRVTMDWKDKATRLLGSRTIYTEGDGPFAFVTPCRNRAFTLWATRADAEQAMNSIMSCGGDCQGVTAHYIVDLGKPS